MTRAEQVTALLASGWQTEYQNAIKRLGGVVKINGNLVRLYSGGLIPSDAMRMFKEAMEKHDPKKLLVVTVAKEDRPD